MFTRIVRTGLWSTVSTPAIAAQWTMCVAPRASSCTASTSSTSAWWNVKFGWSARSVAESASRWRLSRATTSLSSTRRRASVVPMKPAPPLMKMRFPLSTAPTVVATAYHAADARRSGRAHRALDRALARRRWGDAALDAPLRAGRRDAPAGRGGLSAPRRAHGSLRPGSEGRRLHAGLRRAADCARDRNLPRTLPLDALRAPQRLRDRPLAGGRVPLPVLVTGDLRGWLDAASGSDEEFVDRAWRLVVRRAPEQDGRAVALAKLRDGTLSRAGLLRELVASEEFGRVHALDGGLAFAAAARSKPRHVKGPPRPRALNAPAGLDERSIEIPWCLARYDGEPRVLDVGYAFAEPAYLAGLVALGAEELAGVDLAEADVPGLHSVVADVRELPFEDGAFDLAFCISTLEHIGRDNEVYDVEAARDEDGDAAALHELRRVLAKDGRLLVSVPTGVR